MAHILDSPVPKWKKTKSGMQHSTWLNVIAGVIQGIVLGPAMFLLFISDMNEYLPTTAELIKYADDLLTYCIFNIFNDDNTQQIVDSIQEWAKQNKMRLNIDKTKHMIINQTTAGPTNITINNSNLEQVENYKYLG